MCSFYPVGVARTLVFGVRSSVWVRVVCFCHKWARTRVFIASLLPPLNLPLCECLIWTDEQHGNSVSVNVTLLSRSWCWEEDSRYGCYVHTEGIKGVPIAGAAIELYSSIFVLFVSVYTYHGFDQFILVMNCFLVRFSHLPVTSIETAWHGCTKCSLLYL